MKIVVIGGSGLIGTKLVSRLRQRGHDVIAASPASGVNTITREGLAEALSDAQVVVDVANSPSFEDKAALEFFETSGRNLLAAEAAAGVGHHVALSVVGTERLQDSGYFRAKLAQERLIKASGIPYTIVRATQFFEFVGGIAQSGTVGQTVRLSPALVQPISSDDVAAALADMTVGAPVNGTVEVAGPERIPLDELVGRFLRATQDPREVVTDIHAGYFGVELNDQSLTAGDGARIARDALRGLAPPYNASRTRGGARTPALIWGTCGLVDLTKVVALASADTGATANGVCPGWVQTPLVDKQTTDMQRRTIAIDGAWTAQQRLRLVEVALRQITSWRRMTEHEVDRREWLCLDGDPHHGDIQRTVSLCQRPIHADCT